jgi:hypothetical protein
VDEGHQLVEAGRDFSVSANLLHGLVLPVVKQTFNFLETKGTISLAMKVFYLLKRLFPLTGFLHLFNSKLFYEFTNKHDLMSAETHFSVKSLRSTSHCRTRLSAT